MRNIWIIFKREMMAYFLSPIAYIVGACVLAIMGINFHLIVTFLSDGPSDYNPSTWFFNGIFTWIVLLVVPPVITMQLFADEKKTGMVETMMTAPLKDIEYVLAKFLSGFIFFIVLWVPTFNSIFVLRYFSKDHAPLDPGPLMGGYIGLFLMGMLFIAIGCMASASTRNQIIAAVISFTISCSLFFLGIFFFSHVADRNRDFFEYFSMIEHMRNMSRGIIELKRVAFYLSGVVFFLFVTHRIIQSRHWKS